MLKRTGALGAVAVVAFATLPYGTTASATSHEMTFGSPVQVSADDSQSAAEPSIRTARDGTIYIAAPTGLGNSSRDGTESTGGDVLWRSEDDGKTWTFLGSLDENVGGGDADIAPDHNGVLWGSGLTLVNTTASISTDRGETFKVNPIGSLSTVVDRQWIESYKAEPFAFLSTGEIGLDAVILSRLERLPSDVPAVSKTIRFAHENGYQWPGEVAVDENNDLVYVAFNTNGADSDRNDEVVVGRANLDLEEQQMFEVTTTVGDTFDSFVAVDVDQAGNVYAVWSERRPSGDGGRDGWTNSYLAVSKNRGETWSDPIRLNSRPRTTAFPWVVAGSDGRVAVAYYGTRRTGPSPEDVVRKGRRIPKWRVWVAYSLNATDKDPTIIEAPALSKADYLHKGNVCTSGTGCASGTRDLLDFFQLDLTPCGKIVITYTHNARDVVDANGNRTTNVPELIYYVGQKDGPRFYAQPLNPDAC
ncbi:MAG: sialidase family protein [Actinomycetota bacterium]